MSDELSTAWQSVRFAGESRRANTRGNLRKSLKPRARSRAPSQAEEETYENILQRVDEEISHLRNLARTLRDAAYAEGERGDRFRRE